jgi:uncharacterized membrane protein
VSLVPQQSPSDTSAQPAAVTPASAPRISVFQGVVLAVIVVGFAVLSYYSYATPSAKSLGAAVSLAPIVLIGLVLAWRWTNPLVAALLGVLVAGLLYHYWPVLKKNYEWADLLQQFTAYALVAFGFIRSLLAGRVPLCVQLGDKLHGPLSPAEIAYMRRATVAWAIFYSALALAILALFFLASPRFWALFVDFFVFGLIGLMWGADHLIRYRVLPRRPGNLLAALRLALIGST